VTRKENEKKPPLLPKCNIAGSARIVRRRNKKKGMEATNVNPWPENKRLLAR
jgi:hypothetical protein